MCRLKSARVFKDRIFMPDYDSHSDMLSELGIKDNYLGASKKFVRVELSPVDNDVFSDIDSWILKVDQDIRPDWFDEDTYLPIMREKVKEWAKDHIHIGVDGLVINSRENHYIKDCKDVTVRGNATIKNVCGNATINDVHGNATINDVYGNATIKNVCGNATINYVHDNAIIKNVYGNATINDVYGNATINYVHDNAIIKNVYGNATIKNVHDNATINDVHGNATINDVYGNATIKNVCGNATINDVYDNATIKSSPYSRWNNSNKIIICDNATFKDCYTKTLYQSGGWKLVDVNERRNKKMTNYERKKNGLNRR